MSRKAHPAGADRLRALLARLERWLASHRPHYLASLRPGAAPDDLAALERSLGMPLPEELRGLLAWHDGQSDDCPARLEGNWLLLSAARIAEAKRDLDAEAETTGWLSSWIPFLDDDAGDYLALDTAERGHPVREFWLGNAEHPITASSLIDWLTRFIDDLEAGRYAEDPERGEMLRRDDLG